MTGKDLFREIGMIDEKYVVEAEEVKRPVRFSPMLRKSLATVACLCICVGLFFGVRQLGTGGESTANSTADTAGQSMSFDGLAMSSNSASQESESFWDDESVITESATQEVEAAEDYGMANQEEYSEPLQDNAEKSGQSKADSQATDTNSAETVPVEEKILEASRDLEEFLAKTESGKEADIELVQYTIEGDPIFYYIQYNGEDFYMVMDARRDEFAGDERIKEGVYSNLQVFEERIEDGLYNVMWVLTNQTDVTLEEIEQGSVECFTVMQYVQER